MFSRIESTESTAMRRVCATAILILASVQTRADDAKSTFDSLYGQRVQAVERTPSKSDDVALAAELVAASKTVPEGQEKLLAVLCDKAYELASQSPAGNDTAIAVLRLRMDRMKENRVAHLTTISKIRYQAFLRAPRSDRASVGRAYAEAMVELADAQGEAGEWNEAAKSYRRAMAPALGIETARRTEIKGSLDMAMSRAISARKVADLTEKLDADPNNRAAAKELTLLYLTELNDLASASEAALQTGDTKFLTRVKLLADPVTKLDPTQALDLGDWCRGLSESASTTGRPILLSRAHQCYSVFLQKHDAKDLARTKVEIALRGVEKNLKSLGLPLPTLDQDTNQLTKVKPTPNTPPKTTTGDSKKVKVFIMLGDESMVGSGAVGPSSKQGTLEYITNQGKYRQFVDANGGWVQRDDVRYVHMIHDKGNSKIRRNEWLTVKGGSIGPELQFGHVAGDALDEPVLLVKACGGNRSLGWDLLPPRSKPFEFGGRIYAGYKQSPDSWPKGSSPKPIGWYAGKQYDDDIGNVKQVLANIGQYYPGAKDYEVAGFVWWQGSKDQKAAHASRYEQNLVQLIKSLRQDLKAPKAKFVLATVAFDGMKISGHAATIAKAQLAVSSEKRKYRELIGNVTCVDARPFWRPASVSPKNSRNQYHFNAETSLDVGNALGKAMLEMLKK